MLKVLEQGINADFQNLQNENLVLKHKMDTMQENYRVLKEHFDKFEQQITSMLLQKKTSISTIHQARTSSTTPQQAVFSPEQQESLTFRIRSFDILTTPQPRTPLALVQPFRTRTPFQTMPPILTQPSKRNKCTMSDEKCEKSKLTRTY